MNITCSGDVFRCCDRLTQMKDISNPTCTLALCHGNPKLISQLCQTVIRDNLALNMMITIEPNRYFVSSVDIPAILKSRPQLKLVHIALFR